jgi:hypothetical protein
MGVTYLNKQTFQVGDLRDCQRYFLLFDVLLELVQADLVKYMSDKGGNNFI